MDTHPGIALCALALLAVQPGAEELVFEPAQGSRVTRTFVYTSEVALDDLSVEVDGEDMSAMLGEFGFEVEAVQTFVVTDEVLSSADGRIEELQRTFEELGSESEVFIDAAMTSETIESSASSELEGETVIFTWDEDEEAYVASAAEDSEVDDDLLQGLEMAMDLSSFLPDGAVDEGDSWELDFQSLQGIGQPGGNLALLPDEGMEDLDGFDAAAMAEMLEQYQQDILEMIDEWVDGSIRGTFAGAHEADERRLGLIELELELDFEADMSGLIQDMLGEILSEMEIPVEVDISIDVFEVAGETEGDGKLEWDLDEARGRSLELVGDYDFEVDVEVSVDVQDESHEFSAQIAGSGLFKVEVTVE